MQDLIAFWSYGFAACAFASVVLWRVRSRLDRSNQLLLASCFATAVWAVVAGTCGRSDPLTLTFGNLRDLTWIILLYDMSGEARARAFSGMRLVFGAVALAIGLDFVLSTVAMLAAMTRTQFGDLLVTASVLKIAASAGALVLVHNVYGQAAAESRLRIRGPMLGLTLMWGYDLNLSTLGYFEGIAASSAIELFRLQGAFIALTAPLYAFTGAARDSLKIKLSRAATFQSLSLVAVTSYLAVMAILANALRHSELNWASAATGFVFIGLTVGAIIVLPSARARGWLKVKIAKHLFEHRYDYRTEWLRFTETLGRAGSDAPPLAERIVKAFADMADAPGGLLLVGDGGKSIAVAASFNWQAGMPPAEQIEGPGEFWESVETSGRILDLEALRRGWGSARDRNLLVLPWLLDETAAWAGVPLLHQKRLIGIVILAAPEYRRALDWEDFDLLRTAGNQAASSLAEALSQEALANAQRFEEFNRRFAFILHDIKNLVSQLSLLARNAERHADNPDFRADMVATLQSSVGKMNELLARLAPHSAARVQRIEPLPLRPILTAAIAARRRDREVQLLGDAALCALVDASALEQAIGHLLQNALDASSIQPVTVRVTRAPGTIVITIADKGVGMDGDFVRNRLFQPFASSKPGGFGIGAFEARSLIAAMDGRISVDSRPGKGTTFTISLPAAEQVEEPQRKRA